MPPKKQNRAEGKPLTAAQQKKADAAKAKAAEAEAREQERLDEIRNDPLVVRHSAATPALTVTDVFNNVITLKDFPLRKPESGRAPFDWTELRNRLAGRNAESPTWFVHIRTEDLILEPEGLDGEKVQAAIIVEASEPTLAPMHMVVREARPFSDLEDNTPERIVKLVDQGFVWREVRADDGSAINVFLLQEKEKPKAAAATDGVAKSFSFGAAAPAAPTAAPATTTPAAPVAGFGNGGAPRSTASTPSVTTGFGGTPTPAVQNASAAAAALAAAAGGAKTGFGSAAAPAPVAKQPSFGFGGAAPAATTTAPAAAAPTPAASFGFGAASSGSVAPAAAPTFGGRPVSPKPATVPQVGFGANAAPAPAQPSTTAPIAGFGAKSASTVNKSATEKVSLENVQFTLWTEKRLKEMKKEIAGGSRIVIEDFQLPAPVNRKAKVQMQNDVKDSVEATVDFIIRKEFARVHKDVKEVAEWIDACPGYDEKLTTAMQHFRDATIDQAIEDDRAQYDAIANALRPVLTAAFEERVAERKKMLQEESDAIDDILQLLKKKKLLAPKDTYKIIKIFPKNDRLRFRPYGKVGGVHEAGETADECVPPAYVAKNVFAQKVAAMHASGN